ncbi:MAG: serine/threonine protein kinase [Pleurocapsa sp. CRU_1_2]|nr:serine/threonine protein kinase [Pleurocapsa sp. CRU_1_2]
MARSSTYALRDGVILNNRYRIVKQIGRGGFGRAYLAEDTQRYRELCVLKEFAPQVETSNESRQAEDLFEREAGILYKLNHQQIPRFEALLRTRIDGRRSLFLVQEYIQGESYWELLQRRGRLGEAEVTEMIWDILPVLDYIHNAELIHRDISPDNLILRDRDHKPVLIDFGCVKLAANAVSRSAGYCVTLIGKKGYCPDEQIRRGITMPSSDLYSLAATSVVLLTGKQPDQLYDSYQGKWDWNQIDVSPHFKKVLKKMLAERPCDRFKSVDQVRQILSLEDKSVFTNFISRFRTLIVAPGDRDHFSRNNDYDSTSILSRAASGVTRISRRITRKFIDTNFNRVKPWQCGFFASAIVIIPGIFGFALIHYRITQTVAHDFQNHPDSPDINQGELNLQRQVHQRVESLKLDTSNFYKQVDSVFHEQYPELAGKQLTQRKDHQEYREVWYRIARSLLAKQERKRY